MRFKRLHFAILTLFCFYTTVPLWAQTATHKPNVLIIFTDDHRYLDVHALGNKIIKTPNMDKLVENGTTFTRASCLGGRHGALCVFSRAGLMTGRFLNSLVGAGEVIPPDQIMMPEVLHKNGYKTFATGKWHNDKASHVRSFDAAENIFLGDHQQLFNLNKDPFETKNLAENSKYEKNLAKMTEILKKEMIFYHDELDLDKPNWGKVVKPKQ